MIQCKACGGRWHGGRCADLRYADGCIDKHDPARNPICAVHLRQVPDADSQGDAPNCARVEETP